MANIRARIDRRLMPGPAALARDPRGCIVEFRDGWGDVRHRYDLGTLALPRDVRQVLADAFRNHHAASAPGTQRGCWKALQCFARFVSDDTGIHSIHDLNTAMLGRYIAWLDRQTNRAGEPWSEPARRSLLGGLRPLIDWTRRHHPSRLPQRIDFPFHVYSSQGRPRPRIPEEQIKAILRACYEDIELAWERFELGRKVLRGEVLPKDTSAELCGLIRDLAGAGDNVMPAQLSLAALRVKRSAITRHGGLRTLATYLHLTGETLLPFYIALAIQTAANPQPLMQIRRDCLHPHPLDEHRVIIEWDKERAGKKLKHAQRRSFDRRRRNAAPNLIDKLLAMTAPLMAQARPCDRDRLFLVKSEKSSAVVPFAMSTLSHGISGFISRANERIAIWNKAAPERARVPLPDFATVLLRGSVATQHYKASGGDILHVQQILNHASVATTETYLKGPQTERLRRDIVARLQRQMLAWITSEPNTASALAHVATAGPAARATVPFGHDCLNPLGGTAPGAQPGEPCPRLGGCLHCPGLVIPIDAPHLARLLRAKEAFECARDALDPHRWDLLYASSYRILVQDILPDFPAALHAPALALAAGLPRLPALE